MMASFSEQEFLAVFAESLQIEPGALSLAAERGSLPQWDSLGHVVAMLGVEERYGIKFTFGQLDQLKTLAEIHDAAKTLANAR